MKLFLGGYAQGKLEYVLDRYGDASVEVWEEPPETWKEGGTVILNHLHRWVRERIRRGGCPEEELCAFLRRCPDCIIISDEVGNGIVPVDAQEREYRERLGRILIRLAAGAQEVERILCGIGQKIK